MLSEAKVSLPPPKDGESLGGQSQANAQQLDHQSSYRHSSSPAGQQNSGRWSQ